MPTIIMIVYFQTAEAVVKLVAVLALTLSFPVLANTVLQLLPLIVPSFLRFVGDDDDGVRRSSSKTRYLPCISTSKKRPSSTAAFPPQLSFSYYATQQH